jgi:hypothetical protein
VPDDLFRFAVTLLVLMVADFESRTFIGFTYFAIFFCAMIGALAVCKECGDPPIWAWAAPIVLVSSGSAHVRIRRNTIGAALVDGQCRIAHASTATRKVGGAPTQ